MLTTRCSTKIPREMYRTAANLAELKFVPVVGTRTHDLGTRTTTLGVLALLSCSAIVALAAWPAFKYFSLDLDF